MSSKTRSENEVRKEKKTKPLSSITPAASMASLVIWNISKALEKEPNLELEVEIKSAQKRLETQSHDVNTIMLQSPEHKHLTCALLAWQSIGHKNAESLVRFFETTQNKTRDISDATLKANVVCSLKITTEPTNTTDTNDDSNRNDDYLLEAKDDSMKKNRLKISNDSVTMRLCSLKENYIPPNAKYDSLKEKDNSITIDSYTSNENDNSINTEDNSLKVTIDACPVKANNDQSGTRYGLPLKADDCPSLIKDMYQLNTNNGPSNSTSYASCKESIQSIIDASPYYGACGTRSPMGLVLRLPMIEPKIMRIKPQMRDSVASAREKDDIYEDQEEDREKEIEKEKRISKACCLSMICTKKLEQLDAATNELRKRVVRLARREGDRADLLKRAEAGWKELEAGYQRRLTTALKKEDHLKQKMRDLIEQRKRDKDDCESKIQQIKEQGEKAHADRERLLTIGEKICPLLRDRSRFSDEAAATDLSLAEHQGKASQLDRELEYKEEQTRRKLKAIEGDVECAQALIHDAERAIRSDLGMVETQMKTFSKKLLSEDKENLYMKTELEQLRQTKLEMVQQLDGCKAMCDGHIKAAKEELVIKKQELKEFVEKKRACSCKLPIEVMVEVKRTPSFAALCYCPSNAKRDPSCSCTSLRTTLLSNMLSDLFHGLHSEFDYNVSQMSCQLLKCIHEKHNFNTASRVKTNLRKFFSNLLLNELNIAIATSIEKYHVTWVGAYCKAPRMIPPPLDPKDEYWEERAVKRRAKIIAAEMAQRMFEEKSEQLVKRAKEIIQGEPPCECPANTINTQAVYRCVVEPFKVGDRSMRTSDIPATSGDGRVDNPAAPISGKVDSPADQLGGRVGGAADVDCTTIGPASLDNKAVPSGGSIDNPSLVSDRVDGKAVPLDDRIEDPPSISGRVNVNTVPLSRRTKKPTPLVGRVEGKAKTFDGRIDDPTSLRGRVDAPVTSFSSKVNSPAASLSGRVGGHAAPLSGRVYGPAASISGRVAVPATLLNGKVNGPTASQSIKVVVPKVVDAITSVHSNKSAVLPDSASATTALKRSTVKEVMQLKGQIEDLKRETITREDLDLIEKNIAKLIQHSSSPSSDIQSKIKTASDSTKIGIQRSISPNKVGTKKGINNTGIDNIKRKMYSITADSIKKITYSPPPIENIKKGVKRMPISEAGTEKKGNKKVTKIKFPYYPTFMNFNTLQKKQTNVDMLSKNKNKNSPYRIWSPLQTKAPYGNTSPNRNRSNQNRSAYQNNQLDRSYNPMEQTFAVNVCLCGSKKDQNKLVHNTERNVEPKTSWKENMSSKGSGVRPTTLISHTTEKMASNIDNKTSIEIDNPKNCVCFNKKPSNVSIDELLKTLTKWKYELTGCSDENLQNNVDTNESNIKQDSNSKVENTDYMAFDFKNDLLISYDSMSQPDDTAMEQEYKLPAITESEYMGTINLEKSVDDLEKNVDDYWKYITNSDIPIKSYNTRYGKFAAVSNEKGHKPSAFNIKTKAEKGTQKLVPDIGYLQQTEGNEYEIPINNSNKTNAHSLTKNSNNTTKEVSTSNEYCINNINIHHRQRSSNKLDVNDIVKSSALFSSDCDYQINFLGVTLTNVSSNSNIEKLKNSNNNKDGYNPPQSRRKKDDVYRFQNGAKAGYCNAIDKSKQIEDKKIKSKKVTPACRCSVKIDELIQILDRSLNGQYAEHDKIIDTQSLEKHIAEKSTRSDLINQSLQNNIPEKPCKCCEEIDIQEFKDLEVNTFNLIEEHLQERLQEFKLKCKSSCIPPTEEHKLFETIINKIKLLITDSAGTKISDCSQQSSIESSWNRAYNLLQEYLKIKMKHIQCECSSNDNTEAILPDLINKVYNSIEKDFSRLKLIRKVENKDKPKISRTTGPSDNLVIVVPEKDGTTKGLAKSDYTSQLPQRGSKKSVNLTLQIYSQVPPNLGMENKSCDALKDNKFMQTEEVLSNICTSTEINVPSINLLEIKDVLNKTCSHSTIVKNKTSSTLMPFLSEVKTAFQVIDKDPEQVKTGHIFSNSMTVVQGISRKSEDTLNHLLIEKVQALKNTAKEQESKHRMIVRVPDVITVSQNIEKELTHQKQLLDKPKDANIKNGKISEHNTVLSNIGYTLNCSCDYNLGTCICIKPAGNENNEDMNSILKTFTCNKNNQSSSYILHNINKNNKHSDSTNAAEKSLNRNISNFEDVLRTSRTICNSETNTHGEVEIVLKDSRLKNMTPKDITTNTSVNEEYMVDDISELSERSTIPEKDQRSNNRKSVHFPTDVRVALIESKALIDNDNGKLHQSSSEHCDCSMVPVCHVKLLVKNIEKKLENSQCTCDALSANVCPIHAKK